MLRTARALITDPTHWTQHSLACDRHGCAVQPHHPSAQAFCAYGALLRISFGTVPVFGTVSVPEMNPELHGALTALIESLPQQDARYHSITDIGAFNDRAGHAEVLAWFDAAIARRQSKHIAELVGV